MLTFNLHTGVAGFENSPLFEHPQRPQQESITTEIHKNDIDSTRGKITEIGGTHHLRSHSNENWKSLPLCSISSDVVKIKKVSWAAIMNLHRQTQHECWSSALPQADACWSLTIGMWTRASTARPAGPQRTCAQRSQEPPGHGPVRSSPDCTPSLSNRRAVPRSGTCAQS